MAASRPPRAAPPPCGAFKCPEPAQAASEFCVGHTRVVNQFSRWLSCRDDYMASSEVPYDCEAFRVKIGPVSFEAARRIWADHLSRRHA